jgi:hypothetical protein
MKHSNWLYWTITAIEHFLKEVEEEMVKRFSKDKVVKIVIAGTSHAKIMLKDLQLVSNLKYSF